MTKNIFKKKLAEFVSQEIGVPVKNVLLLRHSNNDFKKLNEFGVSVEEHTALQRVHDKYDYRKFNAKALVVVKENFVYGVYKLVNTPARGSLPKLASDNYLSFLRATGRRTGDEGNSHLKFELKYHETSIVGSKVYGWEGGKTRTTIPKNGGKFFNSIEVEVEVEVEENSNIMFSEADFYNQIKKSLTLTANELKIRLSKYDGKAEKIAVSTYAFRRNPDVVALTLIRANGKCESCRNNAPFLRKIDNSPYLEVHHRIPLSEGGEDTIPNTIALCPNCHRKAHFGIKD